MIIYEDGHGIWTCTGDGPGGRISGFGDSRAIAVSRFEWLAQRNDLARKSKGYRQEMYNGPSLTDSQRRRQRRKVAKKKQHELTSLFLIPAQPNLHEVKATVVS